MLGVCYAASVCPWLCPRPGYQRSNTPCRSLFSVYSNLQKKMHAARRPAHLLFLHKPFGHELIDRRFYETRRDALPAPIPLTVVDDTGGIVLDIRCKLLKGARRRLRRIDFKRFNIDMNVIVDQPWHQGLTAAVNAFGDLGRDWAVGDLHDLISVHPYEHRFRGIRAHAIKDPRIFKDRA